MYTVLMGCYPQDVVGALEISNALHLSYFLSIPHRSIFFHLSLFHSLT